MGDSTRAFALTAPLNGNSVQHAINRDIPFDAFVKTVTLSLISHTPESKRHFGNLNTESFFICNEDSKWIPDYDALQIDKSSVLYVCKVVPFVGPKPLPVVGNLYEIVPDPLHGFYNLFVRYGSVVKLNLLGKITVTTNNPDVAEYFCKESEYFTKKITGMMVEIKQIGGQGLFTTNTDDADWALAHTLLMPAFSPKAIKVYTQEMGDIGKKVIEIFDQYASDGHLVEVIDWMTNVTFETIGKIGFGYPFGLLEKRGQPVHPFIKAMSFCLTESGNRFFRPDFVNMLSLLNNRKFFNSMKLMRDTVDEVIKRRKESPDANNMDKDMLGYMLNARESGTGKALTDEIIRDEVITFLIAGHETTSVTLTWLLFELDRHPDIQARLLQEIVDVLGDSEAPSASQVGKLKYLEQCLKETLRIHPPVPGIVKYCKKDCIIPGGFQIPKGTNCLVSIYSMHHNHKVYPNPEQFDPERWTSVEQSKRSLYSWLPFSVGPRGCIGLQFALQEAKIIATMLLRRFHFVRVTEDVKYNPGSITLRPVELKMRIIKRSVLPSQISPQVASHDKSIREPQSIGVATIPLPPLEVIYGSNTGTAQDFASVIASSCRSFGFSDITTTTLDSWSGLSLLSGGAGQVKDRLVIAVSATYNGQPPENANRFNKIVSQYLATNRENPSPLAGISYVVFGCGNVQWRTYQSFPKFIDSSFESLGAKVFFPRGEGNADEDIEDDFQVWFYKLLVYMSESYGVQSAPPARLTGAPESISRGVKVTIIESKSSEYELAKESKNIDSLGKLKGLPTVLESRELQDVSVSKRSTRHIQVELFSDESYIPGDHLEVMPVNSDELVVKFAARIGLDLDTAFVVSSISQEAQIGTRSVARAIAGPCTVFNALKYYTDLLGPIHRSIFKVIADSIRDDETSFEDYELFLSLANPGNKEQYQQFARKHSTILEVLDAFPSVKSMSLADFLCAFQVIIPRRYSISSSAKAVGNTIASISVGVVGFCSQYLSKLEPGSSFVARVRECKDAEFRPPAEPKIPVILICAGTGLSPFRGFLQDRQASKYKSLASGGVSCTELYFGCRNDSDYIYREEIENFISDGTLDHVYIAYSRPLSGKKKYVQHLLLENAAHIRELAEQGGKIFICGSASGLAKDVMSTLETIFRLEMNDSEVKELIEKKVVLDVWG